MDARVEPYVGTPRRSFGNTLFVKKEGILIPNLVALLRMAIILEDMGWTDDPPHLEEVQVPMAQTGQVGCSWPSNNLRRSIKTNGKRNENTLGVKSAAGLEKYCVRDFHRFTSDT